MSFNDPNRLGNSGKAIAAATAAGRAALIGFWPVGYPTVPDSLTAMQVLCEGVDLVEIGLPYTDPFLDGTVIQRAGTMALERGVRTSDTFKAAETVANCGKVPMVMTYWNLIEQYGPERFARDLASAGGAGVITPDLTPDEAAQWVAASDGHNTDRVFLIAPSSTDERITETMHACRGWVYATSVMGVTGARSQTSDAAPVIVSRARQADPSLPVGVGLGVSNGQQAAEVAGYADAVIVGSALIANLDADALDFGPLAALTADLADGVRSPQ